MGRNSHFQAGGTFKCEACGRRTRATGVQSYGSRLCPQDYELAGFYNEMQDCGPGALLDHAESIRQYAAEIVEKGGKLDGDALEMLEIVGDGKEPPKPAEIAPSTDEIVASLKELAFLAESVAHLTGREDTFLPPAERARALIAKLEP